MKWILVVVAAAGLTAALLLSIDVFERHEARSRQALADLRRSECALAFAGDAERLRVLYSVGGVPEHSLEEAIQAGIDAMCACVVSLIGEGELEALLETPEGEASLERCGAQSYEEIVERFGEP